MKAFSIFVLLALAVTLLSAGCKHEPGVLPSTTADAGYPEHIRAILVNRCTSGCHNDASAINSKGLNISSWAKLFQGSTSGAAIVPYSVENSSFLHFVNIYPDLGLVGKPAMPYNPVDPDVPINPLTREEYASVRDWIAAGAPNKNGEVPFSSAAETRQKIYCTMQGCDLLGVIDAASGVIMRYIPIGKTVGIESPHCVRVAPDGRYAYVCFYAGDWIQKIDTRTDQVVGEFDLTTVDPPRTFEGRWNVLHVSPDGERLVITNQAGDGHVIIVRTSDMTKEFQFGGGGSGAIKNPHGVVGVPTFDTFLVTSEYGNVMYRMSKNGFYLKTFTLDGGPERYGATDLDPHEVIFSPDYSKYFVTCQYSNEVRVMDAKTDALLAVIPVGRKPLEMDVSRTEPYIFVTCQEDPSTVNSRMRGSVYAINYNTYATRRLDDGLFYQPHGISVDDAGGKLYIASRNAEGGLAPHHASSCSGRNGWYTVYNLSTLQPVSSRRYEVSVEPYSMDVRFKN